ncbi:MAG: hypothetical protein CHACPFDD_00755 [Phycisphaerae bacterium]|nr:hypothetical protein [Phycisphaerae bacterium]
MSPIARPHHRHTSAQRWQRTIAFGLCPAAALCLLLAAARHQDAPATVSDALQKAEKLAKEQNWAEARQVYDAARSLATDHASADFRQAVEGGVTCALRLQDWNNALERASEYARLNPGTFEQAVAERFAAGIYVAVPHEGTKRGSTYLRGQWTQGTFVSTWRKDRAEAIRRYERSRELLSKLAAALDLRSDDTTPARTRIESERIGVDFDLATILARQSAQDFGTQFYCYWWWTNAWDDEDDSAAVDDADYEEARWGGLGRGWRGWYGWDYSQPPQGLPVGADGQPCFAPAPPQYSAELGDGQKIRFVLEEIERLDTSTAKAHAGEALFRRAMIGRALYGVDPDRGRPYTMTAPPGQDTRRETKRVWELAEDEALTYVGGKLRVVKLPAAENPVALLRLLQEKYPQCGLGGEAQYALGLYFQTRQQFPEALREYERLEQQYPKHERVGAAHTQASHVHAAGIQLNPGTVHLPGAPPKVEFTFRNLDQVEFVARKFDLYKYVADSMEARGEQYWRYRWQTASLFHQDERWKKYLGAEVARWTQRVDRPEGLRAGSGATDAPLTEPGAYVIEVTVAPDGPQARVLVLLTDIAIVRKNLVGQGLIYLADARTGQPLGNQNVTVFEHWHDYDDKGKSQSGFTREIVQTDAEGVVIAKRSHPRGNSQIDAMASAAGGRMAFSFFNNWRDHDPFAAQERMSRFYVLTDRPVYRPGHTVNFRIWERRRHDGALVAGPPGSEINVKIFDPRNNQVRELTLKTDALGGATGAFQLAEEPPLGVYQIRLDNCAPDGRYADGGLFRVEEYKKPEFEVTVTPARELARLGEKIKARVEARYYFGGAVKHGTLRYRVYREEYQHVYQGAAAYDWLYGRGYGRCWYSYPWLPWWGRWGRFCCGPWWWGYPYNGGYAAAPGDFDPDATRRAALRDLVVQGEATLGEDGAFEIQIDTAPALAAQPDDDHRYTIEAEVRDDSRRTIEGRGHLIVTRQSFYAFVEADAGWYRPAREAFFEVRTLTADDTPVAAQGEVRVVQIQYGGPRNDAASEVEVARWPAATDADGRLSFRYEMPREGHYRIVFATKDPAGAEILGNAVVWVMGPGSDGRAHRFNDLEIITDKRTYAVGETAHLLINVAEAQARLLFSDDARDGILRNYRFIELTGKSTVVDVPVEPRHVPNFFVEATLVRSGRVQSQLREVFVPPADRLLDVHVTTDKSEYRPGDVGHVVVEAADAGGRPVEGEVVLAAYDKALHYIQGEFGPDPRTFYYGQRRQNAPTVDTSTDHAFQSLGVLTRPETLVGVNGLVPGWQGQWSLSLTGVVRGDEKQKLAGNLFEGELGPAGRGGGALRGLDYSANGIADSLSFARPAAESRLGLMGGEALNQAGQPDAAAIVDPEIRANFADTALWAPAVTLKNGRAEVDVTFPQSLTTWHVRAHAITPQTHVGKATSEARTTKQFIVRLQSPRFFVERDEVVLSANVHNDLSDEKRVTAELSLPAELFAALDSRAAGSVDPKTGERRLTLEAQVAAGGEYRFDWPVRVLKPGLARITVKALTDEESDGARMSFPVLVHGIDKTIAQSGSLRPEQSGQRELTLDLPQEIDAEKTHLVITASPTLAETLLDALPYLAGYPYGCVEQTMSRFYPSVLVRDTLQRMKIDLETIAQRRKQQSAEAAGARWAWSDSPVFNTKELDRMVDAGLQRLYAMQHNDGGWGWWRDDESSPFQTAYVLQGLSAAKAAGVSVDGGAFERAIDFLEQLVIAELQEPPDKQEKLGDLVTQAYMAYILALEKRLTSDETRKWLDRLDGQRGKLTNYGRALLALTHHHAGDAQRAARTLRNLLQFVERDDTNETAWVRTVSEGWWYWWNSDIETNAWAIKALAAIEPHSELTPRLVKWLLANRRHGYYWRSTRDTAQAIAAIADYMQASGESSPHYTLSILLDGRELKTLQIHDELFPLDNRIELHGLHIPPGRHRVTISKDGRGSLYYACYLSYFTREEDIAAAGNEIAIRREYFRLIPQVEDVVIPAAGALATPPAGQTEPPTASGRREQRVVWQRVPLKTGDAVASGEQIEVVLNITSGNIYDFLAFEDPKPAGCEPVELRSGGRWAGGLCANLELRDERVVFFIGLLEQGQHVLRYRLRAETPGTFHALPTTGFAMYAPEVRAISDEMRLGIRD